MKFGVEDWKLVDEKSVSYVERRLKTMMVLLLKKLVMKLCRFDV